MGLLQFSHGPTVGFCMRQRICNPLLKTNQCDMADVLGIEIAIKNRCFGCYNVKKKYHHCIFLKFHI